MAQFNDLTTADKVRLVSEILSVYSEMNQTSLEKLIENTDKAKGVSFVSIKGYCSDKSGNTEIADQKINIGASYANMLKKDADKYANINFDDFCAKVDSFNLQYINTNGLSEADFKQAVKEVYSIALAELQAPKAQTERSDNFIQFNKVLAWNTNTKNLSIFGLQVTKSVTVKGEPSIVKSAPKTIAKQLINKCIESTASNLRRFNIGNITRNIRLMGDEIEIG